MKYIKDINAVVVNAYKKDVGNIIVFLDAVQTIHRDDDGDAVIIYKNDEVFESSEKYNDVLNFFLKYCTVLQ